MRAQTKLAEMVLAFLVIAGGAMPVSAQYRLPPQAAKSMPDAEIPSGTTLGGDAQDIIFIDDAHVLFIRLHLQLNGLGFREAWDAFTDKFFDYADANGDGWLSSTEVSSAARMLGV